MRRRAACLATVAFAAVTLPSLASPLVAPTERLTPEQEKATFKLPPGFEAQLVAAEPDIQKPMNIAFDARGRLWVTDTIEYPWPVKEGQTGRDTVKVLEDFDDTGRARKITTFAGGLNIPLGVLPINLPNDVSGALVYSIPHVQRMLDTDGDGKADKRETLISGYDSVDTHGMTNNFTRGFDGWVYADHGFKNKSNVKSAVDGSGIRMDSGNVYRFRPDGTGVEYFTHGQVNPFGLSFDPLGNLYSADCHTRPQYMLLRGAYYPSFGKPDDGLGFGPEMCRHDHGSTGIAGTLYYAADHFPEEFRGNLFNGNPVTNAINRDRLDWHGSSPTAVEQPEFLTSSDAWFRPVQVILGPDGEVYVADFYNKIIGHYEVDLKHPGRDRTSGRIWRIVYRGPDGKGPVPKMPNVAAMDMEGLVKASGDANLAVRMLATDRLADKLSHVDGLPTAIARDVTNPVQKTHLAWAMSRSQWLSGPQLARLATDSDRGVRVHAMRILAEKRAWDAATRELAVAGLKDVDPFVQRAAAEALGRQPRVENVRPLLDLRHAVPKDDPQLLHAVRIALRDTLAAPGTAAKLNLGEMSDADRKAIADVMLAVPGAEAGAFVVTYLKSQDVDRDTAAKFLRHGARYVPEQDVDALAAVVTGKFADDVDLQLELFKALREGLTQRGVNPGGGVVAWGKALASRSLAPPAPDDAPAWTNHAAPGVPASADPWAYQSRHSADGKETQLLSSHPRGEQLTGVLRSRPFPLPARLTFYIAGHNGLPPNKLPVKNLIRLKAEGTDEVLAESPPPRNDTAQKVTWGLSKFAGRRGFIEVVDGDTAAAYAWIAFGRLDPAVVPMPMGGVNPSKRQEAGAEIAGWLKLADQSTRLRELATAAGTDAAARTAAAKALVAIDPADGIKSLATVLDDADAAAAVREAAAAALAPLDSDAARAALVAALRTAPQGLQKSIAVAMAASKPGGEALLTAVAEGKASPRLLQDKSVRDRLNTSKPDRFVERVGQLTKGMISADEAIQKLIDQRRAAFDPAKASPVRGFAVFQKNCAACHRLDNVGEQIGPQLDGVGKRGPERLIEDLLDPSRNVDLAFRYSVLTIADGDVLTGLQRREEGETLVFADAQGKEFTVPRAQVRKRVESPLSLMPGNFADVIPPVEFNDLVAYLMSK